jgi:hypothetical protein
VELDLEASFQPALGQFWLEAVLSPSSYLLSPSCLLTGGFAFAVWWEPSPYAGDFVLTLGGYNPGFDQPTYYPTVPRVGFHWQLDSTVNISGGAYLALTPSMLMAGGSLDITFQSGNLKAWCDLYADFLVQWTPFWFEVDFGISIGASYRLNLGFTTKTITAELGASLALWGPPTGGTAKVKWHIFSFTVSFGTPMGQGASQASWSDVETLLPGGSSGDGPNVLSLNAVAGVLPPQTSPSTGSQQTLVADDDTQAASWVVRGASFVFTTSSAIPASSATVGSSSFTGSVLNIAPMGLTGLSSTHSLQVIGPDQKSDASIYFDIEQVTGNVPTSLWGTPPPSGGPTPSSGLTVPSASGQLVSGQLTGLSLTAQQPSLGNTAGQVSVANALAFDNLTLAGAALSLSPSAQPTGDVPAVNDGALAIIMDPQAGINSTSVSGTRANIYAALGTLGFAPPANDSLSTFSANASTALRAQPLLVTAS